MRELARVLGVSRAAIDSTLPASVPWGAEVRVALVDDEDLMTLSGPS
jgi:hypothetical protein